MQGIRTVRLPPIQLLLNERSLLKTMALHEDNDEYDLSELTETNITVEFTEDQFNNLSRIVNANRHRNEDLLELADVLKRASKR